MKIVYVASLLTQDGVQLAGRSLVRHLDTEHDVQVRGAIVQPDSPLLQVQVSHLVISAEALDDVDVVYMEGGWTDGSGGATERFPLDLAESFVWRGGQLIVADVDRNAARAQPQSLADAMRLFGAVVSYGEVLGSEGVRYLHDQGAQERHGMRFFTSQMFVSEWLQPALAGIDSILAGGAVNLQMVMGAVAATGNRATGVLVNDYFVDEGGITPWASVNEFGRGHAALMGAWVSHDLNVDECPDNARWISNLIALLTDRSRETARWTATQTDRHEAEAGLPGLLDRSETQRLGRKASFLVPTDPKRPNVPPEVIQHEVGKSIAALANTDGGHVIIGQDDHRTVLGLGKDFATVRNNDRDGFEQRLVQYTDNHLTPRWETLGLQLHWIEHDAGDVAIVEVPKSNEHVWMRQTKGGPKELYVRRGTRTDAIDGPELISWDRARQRR